MSSTFHDIDSNMGWCQILQRIIRDYNVHFDSIDLSNVDELVREAKEDYNKSTQETGK